jgi:hypothetical protein
MTKPTPSKVGYPPFQSANARGCLDPSEGSPLSLREPADIRRQMCAAPSKCVVLTGGLGALEIAVVI